VNAVVAHPLKRLQLGFFDLAVHVEEARGRKQATQVPSQANGNG
jgi:hypothetical protein